MSQPQWKLVANLGDVSPLDYGGYFVYVDETGAYDPEAELLELVEEDDEETDYEVYRFPLERCTFINGVLSDNKFHPKHAAWFAESIGSIAASAGQSESELIENLCSSDPINLGLAYRAIGEYWGFNNLDHYPLDLSRAEALERYPLYA